jgi:hypothetical protein
VRQKEAVICSFFDFIISLFISLYEKVEENIIGIDEIPVRKIRYVTLIILVIRMGIG